MANSPFENESSNDEVAKIKFYLGYPISKVLTGINVKKSYGNFERQVLCLDLGNNK